ncbi:MAG TPA: hypothetical protein PLZ01_09800 [bacterium]|nr:hypothetical protein [bacterium]
MKTHIDIAFIIKPLMLIINQRRLHKKRQRLEHPGVRLKLHHRIVPLAVIDPLIIENGERIGIIAVRQRKLFHRLENMILNTLRRAGLGNFRRKKLSVMRLQQRAFSRRRCHAGTMIQRRRKLPSGFTACYRSE